MNPPPELEQAVLARQGRREGEEIRFLCPAHDDHRPSARYNPTKGVWCCDACGGGGGWKDLCERLNVPIPNRSQSQVVATYVYRDESGTPLRQKLRWQPGFGGRAKSFSWEKPDDSGGWVKCKGDGNPKVLYGSEELPRARKRLQTVWVVEGEKDCDHAARLGLVAVCNPEGAAGEGKRMKWKPGYSKQLRDLPVVIIADKDSPGRAHAQGVTGHLFGMASSVQLLELPGEHVKDLSDWIAEQERGGKAGDEIRGALEALREEAGEWAPAEAEVRGPDDESPKPTQATVLVELVREAGGELFHDAEHHCYVTVPIEGHGETALIRSSRIRRWLVGSFYRRQGKPPGAQALEDALRLLEAQAQFDGAERQVYTRLGGRGGAIYLDLGNQAWEAVEVTRDGWRVVTNPPVKFRRPRGMAALPRPSRGGSVQELRPLLNLGSEADFILLAAWLLGALRDRGPYPVLAFLGEQGSAKSTQARIARGLLDPFAAPLRSLPRDERDLMIAATNGRVLAFDNLSTLPPWCSDALCRLSTGGGFSTRELYTNGEEVIFSAMRPVILNGIEMVPTRQDLVDRCITLSLPPIPESERRTEAELWAAFEEAHPRILGALLDALSCALKNLEGVNLTMKPRMADFATWLVAAEPGLPWPSGAFLEAYTDNRSEAVATVLENDAVATAVLDLMRSDAPWTGTAGELLDLLQGHAADSTRATRAWPKSPRGLSGRLRRAASFLRTAGVEVEFQGRESGTGRRLITISRIRPGATVTSGTTVTDAPQATDDKEPWGVTVGSAAATTVTDRHAGNPPLASVCDGGDGRDGSVQALSEEHPETEDELAL